MKRSAVRLAASVLAIAALASPAAGASAPTPSVTKAGDCHSITYAWSNFKKARSAEFRIHHFGIYETTRSVAPVGASGSFVMPSNVTFVTGDQYTVLGILLDGSGRVINPSGAVWWGVC